MLPDLTPPPPDLTPPPACTNAADTTVLGMKDLPTIIQTCSMQTFGAEPATKNCIKTMSGLSDACVACFDNEVGCVIRNCIGDCAAAPMSQKCTDCRMMFCVPDFQTCSGLPGG
jgi:hypothetical protein